ncbi:hypothetical protein EWM64_g9221 [Hericium alpestre]|uniref:Sodium/calcium exchanger membrane region domain-containing protein n=1 Tax=Hericium alpestre TaxID=135208 RepID=A0A4Y9ZMX5_9AGAM|nr:hypothetical protein EWM64_g9221 [Hericium alpestre]
MITVFILGAALIIFAYAASAVLNTVDLALELALGIFHRVVAFPVLLGVLLATGVGRAEAQAGVPTPDLKALS